MLDCCTVTSPRAAAPRPHGSTPPLAPSSHPSHAPADTRPTPPALRELKLQKGARRRLVTTKLVMRQLLEALQACHSTGIVHRDVKPQNCIVSEAARRIKLIDLGAAADLRIGINYVPNEYLLDPRWA